MGIAVGMCVCVLGSSFASVCCGSLSVCGNVPVHRDRRLGASDSGAILERFKSDSASERRFGKAGAWVSERFERDHCPLV